MNTFSPTIYFYKITNINIDPEILSKLPNERQQRINSSLRKAKAKQLYASSLLLRYVLNKYGISLDEIKTTENGKPYVEMQLHFNVSHSGDYVVAAISHTELGIDIQEKNSVSDNAARIFFGNIEESSTAQNAQYYYSYIWCRKEALLKCLGVGWNGKKEQKLPVLKNHVVYNGSKYYLTDYKIAEDYFFTLCEKEFHEEFAVKEVSDREFELLYRSG